MPVAVEVVVAAAAVEELVLAAGSRLRREALVRLRGLRQVQVLRLVQVPVVPRQVLDREAALSPGRALPVVLLAGRSRRAAHALVACRVRRWGLERVRGLAEQVPTLQAAARRLAS